MNLNHNYRISAGKVTATLLTICSGILFWASKSFAANDVTLAWDPNSEPNIAGYRLYCGTHAGVYTQTIEVGNATTILVSKLVTGTTYFFTVTAYDTTALESARSNEVSVPSSPTPTASPTPSRKPSPTPVASPSPTPTPSPTPRPTPITTR